MKKTETPENKTPQTTAKSKNKTGPSSSGGALDPMAVMQIASSYWQSKVLHTAVRLDVFTLLKDGPLTANQLAKKCKADKRGLEILLIAVVSLGLLKQSGGKYRNSRLSNTFLVKGAKKFQGGIVGMFDSWYGAWGDLYDAVVQGKPVVDKPHDQGPEALRNYIYGMHHRALGQGNLLAKDIDFSDRKHLLDVAGGPGTFDVMFCKKNKGLSATVLDLPQTLEITTEIVTSFGLEKRINRRPGNYLTDASFGKGYDAVLLSSMFNQESPKVIGKILKKSFNALDPGGLILVQDQMLNRQKTGPALSALIGVNQLIHTPGGAAYSEKEVSEWMRATGFKKVRTVRLSEPSPFVVLLGEKPRKSF
ncbi:MAG: class I SAM-dependent methyltransferase [Nitrospiria bacterium]